MRNLAAYTAPTTAASSYPAYISVNQRDSTVYISLRGPATTDGNGQTIAIPSQEFFKLLTDMNAVQGELFR